MQMIPNTENTPTVDEVRASMLRWFAEAMPEYTPEQFRSFKAHLFPDPVRPVAHARREPDYEGAWEDRYDGDLPWRR